MAKKGRNGLEQAVGTNIYDNANKEILASMIRSVLEDYRDSHFNLLDDQLANLKFNSEKTLQQYLNDKIGRIPKYGTFGPVEVGVDPNQNYNVDGLIKEAKTNTVSNGSDHLIRIEFNESVANRRLIPVLTYPSGVDWNQQNDIAYPVIRRIGSTTIDLALREISGGVQSLTIEIIAI
mgnify:CR=1 FL=1|tara:strand:- start:31 stop:564 length:534 start_codon:yes stop_codon:yes gene_type:complete